MTTKTRKTSAELSKVHRENTKQKVESLKTYSEFMTILANDATAEESRFLTQISAKLKDVKTHRLITEWKAFKKNHSVKDSELLTLTKPNKVAAVFVNHLITQDLSDTTITALDLKE
ncbi:hypothetical protein AN944_02310 [Shewanella sp. P1-14-1]|uniref:hypothetical protein n=1 Tax=Shewanella sp. P1-14-1 TaxID=1723761 RepID=UPI0006D68802|nr:hypothetical protein [Shewanella sp. P1-14-1]KPZ70238.1 hypothetical protein AN944_02310 [Shewanella sp. P1-14-1]